MNKKGIRAVQLGAGILSIGIIIISSVNIAINVSEYNQLKKEATAVESKAQEEKTAFVTYKKEIEEEAYSTKDNENELVNNVFTHNNSYKIMSNLANEFFTIYFTWEDSKEYRSRTERLKNIAEPSLLENKEVFDEGKDTTGGDYITALNVQSEFIHSEVSLVDSQTGIVKVVYKSWYGDKSKSGEGTRYYQVDFDRKDQKVKNLKLVFSTESNG